MRNISGDQKPSRVLKSQDQLPQWLNLCASVRDASLRLSFSSACLRSVMSSWMAMTFLGRPSESRKSVNITFAQTDLPSLRMKCDIYTLTRLRKIGRAHV